MLMVTQTALELGFLYALVAMALFLSFRILNIADMTTDGCFVLGAAVSVTLAAGGHPILAIPAAMLAGSCAGFVTAFLQTRLGIPSILAGIVTNTGLYTVNLMAMGWKANQSLLGGSTIFTLLRDSGIGSDWYELLLAAFRLKPDCRALADADPATLQRMLADGFPAADTNRAGQIATGFSWKFYAVCDLDTAARFDGLSTVKISVPGKQNTPLSATVEEVTEDKDNGIAKIVLQCQTISAEVLGLGCETVQVDLKTYEGIRIDKAALHIVNGQRGVYVKYGNLQRFLKITTLYENDSYILVPEDGKLGSANEVRLYDEIIVQGTNLEDGKLL